MNTMAEERSHFRIRNGEIEIEYDGPLQDVNERYAEAFEWLKGSTSPIIGSLTKGEKAKQETDTKKGTRGPEIWSPAIDTLIKDGFFKLPNKRQRKDVVKALENKALPVQGKGDAIKTALTRKVRKGDLKGTKGPDGWTFWTE